MTRESENGQSPDSGTGLDNVELVDAVHEAVNDWVEGDDIPVYRHDGKIIADEAELVKNISSMVAIAVDEASD